MNSLDKKVLNGFHQFERWITILVSIIIGLIILLALVRILENFYSLFVRDFFEPEEISFNDYQQIFGKILTLLISFEFMNSILKTLKTHSLKSIVPDVILIAALAIARKLIIYEYSEPEPGHLIALGVLLVALGIFYILVKNELPWRRTRQITQKTQSGSEN